ncbi:pantoate--beta-alanine ligase [Aliidiomarina quisquiliarum]|uniref:pantoate--beta-alanine ligase n=1 Tax=Aliidiomarina quisquiliarum TaxID=2938947 RepID=UPI00208E2F68|nr:pantoate--beta-alanine ligase [Aliidiomarina quisquiliarum]MCO4322605.1 pantoate--beta-alanine ligase [Aliidiomarina quisquiliarum]
MQQIDTIAALRAQRALWRQKNESLAFVPTMGNLHDGHLALVEQAKTHAERVLVSIFVNPLQFGANEDLDRYPRTLQADLEKLKGLGVDAVFTPAVSEVYPRGLEAQTVVSVPGLSSILCGAKRPGHFEGVTTVVSKLFNMVQPDAALFGKKDYQQLQVIRFMAHDLCMPIKIIGVETQREKSGLALSSRNGYLTAQERQQAAIIYRSLQEISLAIENGESITVATEKALAEWYHAGLTPDYLEVKRLSDLQTPTEKDHDLIVLAAAYIGTTRLIDNLSATRK